jgi:hypothetical protein
MGSALWRGLTRSSPSLAARTRRRHRRHSSCCCWCLYRWHRCSCHHCALPCRATAGASRGRCRRRRRRPCNCCTRLAAAAQPAAAAAAACCSLAAAAWPAAAAAGQSSHVGAMSLRGETAPTRRAHGASLHLAVLHGPAALRGLPRLVADGMGRHSFRGSTPCGKAGDIQRGAKQNPLSLRATG